MKKFGKITKRTQESFDRIGLVINAVLKLVKVLSKNKDIKQNNWYEVNFYFKKSGKTGHVIDEIKVQQTQRTDFNTLLITKIEKEEA